MQDPRATDRQHLPYDSDEEFKIMDDNIATQVLNEKRRNQLAQGQKLSKICASVGRCPICTLVPPCRHRVSADWHVADE